MTKLSEHQKRVGKWARETLGEDVALDPTERALRMVEEAVELAQALGVTLDQVTLVADHVYCRPEGEVEQEISGCLMTVLAAADAVGVDAERALTDELDRVENPEVRQKVRRKHQEKFEAGVSVQNI